MPVYRVISRGLFYNQVCENVLHFARDDGIPEDQVAEIIRTSWWPTLRSMQNEHFAWSQVLVQNLDIQGAPMTQFIFPAQNGTLLGKGSHPSLAILFSTRAACAGRHCHGRIYIPGVHEEGVLNGAVEPGYQSLITQFAGLMVQRFAHGGSDNRGLELVIVNRKQVSNFKSVVQIVPRFTFGIQRRRNIGVGL